MNYSSPLPFELGETVKGTDADSNIITPDWAGKIFVLSDSKVNDPRKAPRRTGRQLIGVPLLNNSGITLYGKRLARFKQAGGFNDLCRVDGYGGVTLAEKHCVLIDEYLASSGVADKYYFWGILKGPALILTAAVGADFNGDIAVAAQLVAATGSTSGASANGRVSNVTLPGTTGATVSFNAAANLIATALSARTTGETSADLLVNMCIHY